MISNEEFKLIEKRMEAWSEKIGIASISVGNFTKEQILEHIKAKDKIGREFAQIQLNYVRRLKDASK